uniref:tRNA (uracil(54)-C(5))-methyltransferase n=1 Tax=Paramormyrops kingsleyae TaxID=1676925 RepID=A0A3B3TBK5_9TELE|nr:tRNA (uracil(54)-C(5))-methyltransferase homolog [Paramormyrops kingsleyae]
MQIKQIFPNGKYLISRVLLRGNLCTVAKNESPNTVIENTLKTLPKKKRKKYIHGNSQSSSWEERLADVVTPLWRLSYDEQLRLKQMQQKKILQELSDLVKAAVPEVSLPLNNDNLSFPLLPIKPSPVIYGYRNKSTFSVNKGVDGDPKTVGFFVGSGKCKNIVCINDNHLLNTPAKHKMVARHYEDFIRTSPLDPCLLFHEGGHWREITVRTNSAGETMAIVFFHPQSLTPEEIYAQKACLVDHFIYGPGTDCKLDALYFQESSMTRCSNEVSPYQLLHGNPHIYEEVLGCRFRISADAFFQVNTKASEVLYHTVGEMCLSSVGDTLLDVCCGTGAIGISLASKVKRVIGIEVIEQAVKDARHNAFLNGKLNCDFLAGKAEVLLPKLIPSLGTESSIITVVNPSRAGVHHRVIRALRSNPAIRKLIYISCKPEGEGMRNFKELCCPLEGQPFRPVLAIPVDMFPHIAHCELVLVFER